MMKVAKLTGFSLCILTLQLWAQPGLAARPQDNGRLRFQRLIAEKQLPTFTKNHIPYIALSGGKALGADYVEALGPNVVEFFKSPRSATAIFHHLYTRVGKKTWSRVGNALFDSDWYLASGKSSRIGVLVSLTDDEMRRFNEFLAHNSQSPKQAHELGAIGDFDAYGGGGGPNGTTHCTNYLECALVGDGKQSLPELFGLHGTGIAPNWIQNLIKSNSPRVIGVVVHNPQGDFNEQYDLDKFFR